MRVAEKKAAVAQAERARQAAQLELDAAKKAQAAVDKLHRDAAAKAAEAERRHMADP